MATPRWANPSGFGTLGPVRWGSNSEPRGWSTVGPVSCDPVEVPISQVLPATLFTNTDVNGRYRNYLCQQWNIVSSEGQVNWKSLNKITSLTTLLLEMLTGLCHFFWLHFSVSSSLSAMKVSRRKHDSITSSSRNSTATVLLVFLALKKTHIIYRMLTMSKLLSLLTLMH